VVSRRKLGDNATVPGVNRYLGADNVGENPAVAVYNCCGGLVARTLDA